MQQQQTIIIIGGGPAGMMAAIRAASMHNDVVLIEKNTILGKKLSISGHGRCNVTNTENQAEFLKHYFDNGDFLRDVFKKFSNDDLMAFLTARGVQLKIEDNGRVLPVSNKAASIVEMLLNELKMNKVALMTGVAAKRVVVRDKHVCGIEFDDGRQVSAKAVIVATGGITYPLTGSDGGFFKALKNIGHTVVALRPALVPLEIVDWNGASMLGVSIEDCSVGTVSKDGKKYTARGAIIFTHWGLSGPAILSLSRFAVATLQERGSACITLDVIPEMGLEEIRKWLFAQKEEHPESLIKNVLNKIMKKSVGEFFLRLHTISADKKCGEMSKKEINRLSQALKVSEFPIKKCRSRDEAMVTQGGVSLKEIDPKSMGSRLVKGLFFAGEVINIDGDSGGYNIQLAFSTGYVAGESAVRSIIIS